jgi:hypothetical protein
VILVLDYVVKYFQQEKAITMIERMLEEEFILRENLKQAQ